MIRIFRQQPDSHVLPVVRGIPISDDGLEEVIDSAVTAARFAANTNEPMVFCPPIACFTNETRATEEALACGLAVSVELDRDNTHEARKRLEQTLGPATVVVASGGTWIDTLTGAAFPKLHLHWRLSEPTRDAEEHAKLKLARRTACALVDADPSAQTPVHPLRWPGSWHLKDTPQLARIVELNPGAEVHLVDVLDVLEDAAEAAGNVPVEMAPMKGGDPQADVSLLHSAMATIPNRDEHWEVWNGYGMAMFRATDGSQAGLEIWRAWSEKSINKHVSDACEQR